MDDAFTAFSNEVARLEYRVPCRGREREFMGDGPGRESPLQTAKRVKPAVMACQECAVKQFCLQAGRAEEYPTGVWGGEFFYRDPDPRNRKQTDVRAYISTWISTRRIIT